MTKSLARFALAASAFVVAFAPVAEPASAAAATKIYTHADSGRTVGVSHGAKFKVRLKVCETCGYHWSFAKRPDKHVIVLKHKTDVSSAKPPAVGGINTVTWTFKAVGKGKTTMRLVEHSPAQQVTKHFRLTVKVHPRHVNGG
ncbi:MAG TPA: protease inhibitor I42 family protein [Mycobacteriales bacterium]|jgi:predicted secreted protein|nr:protease inhibitor I42 family protein [Mycobacteriales bacterium]